MKNHLGKLWIRKDIYEKGKDRLVASAESNMLSKAEQGLVG